MAAVADRVGDDLAGSAAKGDPQLGFLGFSLYEAPEFIEFEHVARLAGQERVLERWQSRHFFPPPRP